MVFRIVQSVGHPAQPGDVLLVKDNWNDWYTWVTQFYVVVVGHDRRIDLGRVKIGRAGMTPQNAVTHQNLPTEFERLDDTWFSVGQEENYYETLQSLGEADNEWFLIALRDCAFDLTILERFGNEEVLRNSLLRDISVDRVKHRFHRLSHGNAALTPFAFSYHLPPDPRSPDPQPILSFDVRPRSQPSSNIHVLIGRNGVGKTRCFDLLSRTFLGLTAADGSSPGSLVANGFGQLHHGFAGLVTVSFSPFDKYGPLVDSRTPQTFRYAYVGLKGIIAETGARRHSRARST